MDDSEAMERLIRMRTNKAEEKERKTKEKQRFLTPDLGLDDLLRQANARVYHMKSNQFTMLEHGTVEWEFPKRADARLGKFKRAKKRFDDAEIYVQAAMAQGNKDLAAEEEEKANDALAECLMHSYVINYFYTEFLGAAHRKAHGGKHG